MSSSEYVEKLAGRVFHGVALRELPSDEFWMADTQKIPCSENLLANIASAASKQLFGGDLGALTADCMGFAIGIMAMDIIAKRGEAEQSPPALLKQDLVDSCKALASILLSQGGWYREAGQAVAGQAVAGNSPARGSVIAVAGGCEQ